MHEGKPQASPAQLLEQWQTLMHLVQVLGFEAQTDGDTDAAGELDEGAMAAGRSLTIADLIQQRQMAQQQRDFATADDIRDQLAAVGITVVDQSDGEGRWHQQ